MDFTSKKLFLENIIKRNLTPLIDRDYVLLGNPYHSNIGDHLIWEGTVHFLSTLPFKCKGSHNITTWNWPKLSKDIIIIFNGGGNFGDLHPEEQSFRLAVIKQYPNNKIIILPQSIAYQNNDTIKSEAEIINSHPNLTICLRDNMSYSFAKTEFSKCKTLLIPDMAFHISNKILEGYRGLENGSKLYLRRTDKEWKDMALMIPEGMDNRDWPTIDRNNHFVKLLRGILFIGKKAHNFKSISGLFFCMADKYANHFVRRKLIKTGMEFLSPYSEIITTRLHVMILAILLHKPVKYCDNCSGKLSAFASTWLSDLPQVSKFE